LGVQLGEIVPKETIAIEILSGRKMAIDAFNSLYQFLSIIRQPDGTPLMDSKQRVTSHLSGLFYRTGRLVEAGILPCYVFDGKPPVQKHGTIRERSEVKEVARAKYKEAAEKEDVEGMRRYAMATSRLTDDMIVDSKRLLQAMGIPVVQAPGEGEAQAAHIAAKGDVWASASQDFDSLLFNSPVLIRNLTITGRRKLPRKNVFVMVEPELIELKKALDSLGLTREQLVDIAILIGTDYNEGVKGIGPKKALAAVKEGKVLKAIYKEHEAEPETDLDELRKLFLKPDVTEKYALEWKAPDKSDILKILVDEHDFSAERVEKVVATLEEKAGESKASQARLGQWFG
jgi:flap endonuclease-1